MAGLDREPARKIFSEWPIVIKCIATAHDGFRKIYSMINICDRVLEYDNCFSYVHDKL